MAQFGFGQAMRRKEDRRFLTGAGVYLDDLDPPGVVHAAFLRSPEAHAQINAVDTRDAEGAPGVIAVFTGADWERSGYGNIPLRPPLSNRDGAPIYRPPYPALAVGRVRHVGQPIAMVVAATRAQAEDALERIEVDLRSLPIVRNAAAALEPGAALVWDEAAGNVGIDWETGSAESVSAAFADAAHVIEASLYNNRLVPNPIEPRGAIGHYDAASGERLLEGSVQGVFGFRNDLANVVFGCAPESVRVVAHDVGGGFGCKNMLQPEHVMVLFAAERLGRPVKWVNTRVESFLSDVQGRDQRNAVRLALDADLRFKALEIDTVADLGAYLSSFGPFIPTGATASTLGGAYEIPAIYMRVRGVYSNSVPTDAYRGAGRPEAAYIIERVVERAARALGVDPTELRRRNLIRPQNLPYRNGANILIDCGDFASVMDRALALADVAGFAERAAQSRQRGRRRGLGVAYYLESTLGQPGENARIAFAEDGTVTLCVGTQSNGQGHETVFAQILAERLGIPPERIVYRQADTADLPSGGGHGGSRSLQIGGSAVLRASERIIDKARLIAAHLLEAATEDVEYDAAGDTPRLCVAGTDRAVDLDAVVEVAFDADRRPPGLEPGLSESADYEREHYTYPNGCHVVEVEVDPDTGAVTPVSYTVVDDFGRIINPMIVRGQVMGGVAQGLGQALLERCVYDDDAQLVSASLMDYCLPRADDLPAFEIDLYEDAPPSTNPLGIKGCGEAGCIPAPPATVNAVLNALDEYGIDHLDMPLTPQRVWQAIRTAQGQGG